jgi:crotonobetainyl-CoA:carnitine CoA-transferase CaiB-like acyl-CoA transferase
VSDHDPVRDANPTLPFSGYTVLDVSGSVATATAGKLFADFGARVVNVEPPGGHPTRHLPPHRPGAPAPESSGLHALLSPNKESVVIDLDDRDRREALLDLVAAANVVLESEPPGVLPAKGLDFDALACRAPELILASLTWYGQTGPMALRPANDATICCELGLVKAIGRPEGPPLIPSGYPVQIIGGVSAFIAATAHLVAGVISGARHAAHLDVSLFEAAMCLTEVAPVAFFNGGQPLPRLGLNRFVPTFPGGLYRVKEGWIGVTALTPMQWRSLCELVELPELGKEPRYRTTFRRLLNADEIDARLAPALERRTAEEWFHAGQARRIPLTPVPAMAELLESDQLRALDAFRRIDHPDLGTFEVPAAPFRLHRTPAPAAGRVARLGAGEDRGAGTATGRDGVSIRTPLREPSPRPPLLRGVRVVDLSMGWAGPLAARHLADLGAEVIKVEACDHFDWWRGFEVTPEALRERAIEKSWAFNTVNRNKLGITLDLAHPRGAELLKRLVAISDVVLENYSGAVLEKLGLGATVLREVNPRLVMLSMPPFGAGGPHHHYRAYGSTVEQASGLPHLQGSPGDPPIMLHVALGDPVAGIHGAAALLLAMLHQQRTGEGQFLDLSQVQALLGVGLHGIASQVLLGEPPPRLGNRHPLYTPQGVYRCRGDDQWVVLSVESDGQWRALCELMGDPSLGGELERADGRRDQHDRIDERLSRWTGAGERDAVVKALLARGIPAAGVLDVHEVLTHPQLESRDFWQWIEREHVGVQPQPVAPYRSSAAPYAIDWPAPTLGQQSREVLRELLGLSEQELDELEREGVTGTEPLPST